MVGRFQVVIVIGFVISLQSIDLIQVFVSAVTHHIDAKETTSKHLLPLSSIIIQTQQQNYEYPNLNDYRVCHETRSACLKNCESSTAKMNRTQCEAECPVCPVLLNENILIQDVNDSVHHLSHAKAQNTTNIIRLTNEIHNIIDQKWGNITQNTTNNVHVYQNFSRIGGRFGYGFVNRTQYCCIVLRPYNSFCNSKKKGYFRSNKHSCKEYSYSQSDFRKYRMCSEHCKSDIMYAKPIIICELDRQPFQDIYDDETNFQKCYQTIRYIPYKKKQKLMKKNWSRRVRCHYSDYWPYVNCNNRPPYRDYCRFCYRLSYGNILRYGLPFQCRQCFSNNYYYPYPYVGSYYPNLPLYYDNSGTWPYLNDEEDEVEDNYDDDNDNDVNENDDNRNNSDDILQQSDGIALEDTVEWKCKLPNGSTTNNCADNNNIANHNSQLRVTTENSVNEILKDEDEVNEILPNYQFNYNSRKRHLQFRRSKYSRRYPLRSND